MGTRIGFGLRDRVTLAFGVMALALSLLLAIVVWTVVSSYLLAQRESSAVSETSVNAALLQRTLAAATSGNVPAVLDGFASQERSSAVLAYGGSWYATTLGRGMSSLPAALVREIEDSVPARQRISLDDHPYLAVEIPLDRPGDAYVELYDLGQLSRTFQVLSTSLVIGAALSTVCGLVLGWFASHRVLRPLAELNAVADRVASGDLAARLGAEDDPDLDGLARSFNHTVESLELRVQADERFAADVSHELRTPLTTMLNSMEVLQNRRETFAADVREPLDLLADDLARFRRLVVDLLDISRPGTDDGGGVREVVGVAELVRQAADTSAGRPVTEVSPEAETLTLCADKRRLERVVANLVENADIHGGGCCGVSVRAAPDTESVRILVDDAGAGVVLARREHVFERFNRSGAGSPGVGLGLAIVERHVRWHGGSVWIEDRPGGGARFVVELPAVRGSTR